MAASVQGGDSLDDIVQKSPDKLATFIRKVEGQGKMILVPSDIIGIELGKRSKDAVFRRFLSSVQEAFVSSPCVVVAAAASEYARVTANINPPAIEKLSESDYNMYKDELVTASQAKPQVNPYSTLSEAIWSITEYFSKATAGTNNATRHSSWSLKKKKIYFDIVIFSSHGIFSHEKRYCNSSDQANSILRQVRDMEKKILECTKQIKPSITPRIYIVTQLLPGVVQTTKSYLLKKLKSANNAHVVQITLRDNKGIFHKRTSEFELTGLTEDIKVVTDKVLQRSPILIIGSDRDGNQRASLLAKDVGAMQISGDRATEASWRGGARKYLLEVRKIQKQ